MKRIYTLLTLAVLATASALAGSAVFDFTDNALSMFDGITGTSNNGNDGDITSTVSTVANGVTLTVSPATGTTPNRIWESTSGYELRMYTGTMVISVADGSKITSIETESGSKAGTPVPSVGTWSEKSWTGEAESVTLTFTTQYQFKKITVYTDGDNGGGDEPGGDEPGGGDGGDEPGGDEPVGTNALFDFHNNGLTMFDGITDTSNNGTDGDFTENKTVTVNGISLTVSPSGASAANRFWNDYNNGLQLRMYGGTITIAAPAGYVLKSATIEYGDRNGDPSASTGSISSGQWTGNASRLVLTFSQRTDLNSIDVTFAEGEGDGDEPGDDDVNPITNFFEMAALDDGTEFTFNNNLYVLYQNGKYLYGRALYDETDEDGYTVTYLSDGLLFGDVGYEYEPGDIIPAGWKATKTTFRSCIEATGMTGLQEPIGKVEDEAYIAAYNNDDYFADWWEDYDMNAFYEFTGKTYDMPDESGNFKIYGIGYDENYDEIETYIDGYNKFGIEIPEPIEGRTYTITGFSTMYNNNWQFYPITISEDPGTPMWKIWYTAEDGEEYRVGDDLYIGYVDEDNKLIYVTDNATEVYFDLYDWLFGSWDEEWEPDWAAIDCGGNDDLFNQIKAMNAIKANTLFITVQDNLTNPRWEVSVAPEALEGTDVEIFYNTLTMDNPIETAVRGLYLGNCIEMFEGYLVENEGKTYLADTKDFADAEQYIELDRTVMDRTDFPFNVGGKYSMRSIIKIGEEWEQSEDEDDDDEWLAPAKVRSTEGKALNKKGRTPNAAVHKNARRVKRNMLTDDPAYFTNFTLIPVDNFEELEPAEGGNKYDVNGDGKVNVADVNIILNDILNGGTDIDLDINNDDAVNVADVNVVLNYILTHSDE